MNKAAILLSLGHNSSAIYFDGQNAIGYETERLDRIKSSSASPILAIQEIQKFVKIPKQTPVYITNWFDKYSQLPDCKYSIDLNNFIFENKSSFMTHNKDFTHHDAHAWSVLSFYRYYNQESRHFGYNIEDKIYTIVADGFGNFQETISIYEISPVTEIPKLAHRVYGYETSLGLMYQYATDFVGMKMNQDEYKFLGYESMLWSFFNEQHSEIIDQLAGELCQKFMKLFHDNNTQRLTVSEQLINYDELLLVKEKWQTYFQLCLDHFRIQERESFISRVLIANIIQRTIENALVEIIRHYGMKHVLLAGGIFYNVKLNNRILKEIPGIFSVVPLAGDQGASIGFYEKFCGNFNWETLAIGKRDMSDSMVYDIAQSCSNVWTPKTRQEAIDIISYKIRQDEIVNVVRSNMEFGPRALGHTSSLFLPTQENADYNNKLNNRNEVMPFAPMIHYSKMRHYFDMRDYSRVIGSDKFMILTYDYLAERTNENAGVMHHNPLINRYTGRPQAVDSSDKFLNGLLFELMKKKIDIITNTSYNYHGEPIVFSLKDVLKTHYKQLNNSKKKRVNLVIYKDENDITIEDNA